VKQDHPGTRVAVAEQGYELSFPRPSKDGYEQDEEWCEIEIDGERRRIRFHDYHELYAIPGLYEQVFYDHLKCDSPRTVCALLSKDLVESGIDPAELRVLDVGAGNGIVGEELTKLDVETIVGIDIVDEAAEAAKRDRPGVYDDYLIADLTDLTPKEQRSLDERRFNCLVTVAALGFGDIPPEAFVTAYNMVEPGGRIVFNIKERFIDEGDKSGFQSLIEEALDDGTLEFKGEHHYRHRLSLAGNPLNYVAIVAEKRTDLA
jgi:2-polyprenyl-3-methyl-5-hydroxy-6-metoxy-1,4-benzoquinol methylase